MERTWYAFQLPVGQFDGDPDGWLHMWSGVGTPTLLPVALDRNGVLQHISFCATGRYTPIDEGNRIYVTEEDCGRIACFFAPGTVISECDLCLAFPVNRALLRNTVWPIDMALRLSKWHPTECKQLCGITCAGEIWEVQGGGRKRQLPIVPNYTFPAVM